MKCVCGCGARAVVEHHAVYVQHLDPSLRRDGRNLVGVAWRCHERHHNRTRPYALAMLPDSVFEFAGEVMGPGAYDYLRRRYAGEDARLDGLLDA